MITFQEAKDNSDLQPITVEFNNPTHIEGNKMAASGFFSNSRIDADTIPEGYNLYHFRHGDDGNICSLEAAVGVNHAGCFITKETLVFTKPYFSIEDGFDYNFNCEEELELD